MKSKMCILRQKKTLFSFISLGVTLLCIFYGHESLQSLLKRFAYKCKREMENKTVQNKLCGVNLVDTRARFSNTLDQTIIYFVTPTYPRPEQVPELTRLAHTLMHVPRIHWIVADDQPACSDQVATILRWSGLPFTHISSPRPYTYKCMPHPKGVANRLASVSWLLTHTNEGVIYFGDDDNALDLQLFDEIRNTKRVSMFPVGLIGSYGVSSPIIKNGKVSAFFDSWSGQREFPVDMAGFALNVKRLSRSSAMPYLAGNEENGYLKSLGVKVKDIEPLADNCSKVLVWHTRTLKHQKKALDINMLENAFMQNYPNLLNLFKEVYKQGIWISDSKSQVTVLTRNITPYGTLVTFHKHEHRNWSPSKIFSPYLLLLGDLSY